MQTVCVCLVVGLWLTFPHPALAEPFIPDSDSTVLEHLPLAASSEARTARLQLFKEPDNIQQALRVARTFVEMGHAEADPRYDGYAQSALQPWWDQPHPPVDVLFLRAVLRQRRHQFDEALHDLNTVLRLQPNHAQAWLTLSIIYQVRGEYEHAKRSCLPLLPLSTPLIATACIANTAGLNGQAQSSYEGLLKMASTTSTAHPSEQLWVYTLLGETAARLGEVSSAEAHFQHALSLGRHDTYLLGAYSDWLLDQNRAAEVLTLLKDEHRADPLLLRVALAAKHVNSPQFPQYLDDLRERFEAGRLRGDARHLREEARSTLHLLQKPHQALELAEKNWEVQREPWDARILLETAGATGSHDAAGPVLEWLRRTGCEDRQIRQLAEQVS